MTNNNTNNQNNNLGGNDMSRLQLAQQALLNLTDEEQSKIMEILGEGYMETLIQKGQIKVERATQQEQPQDNEAVQQLQSLLNEKQQIREEINQKAETGEDYSELMNKFKDTVKQINILKPLCKGINAIGEYGQDTVAPTTGNIIRTVGNTGTGLIDGVLNTVDCVIDTVVDGVKTVAHTGVTVGRTVNDNLVKPTTELTADAAQNLISTAFGLLNIK